MISKTILHFLFSLLIFGFAVERSDARNVGNNETQSCCNTITIITSFSILSDLVKNLVQDIPNRTFQIQSIVPCESDPHTFEAKPGDVKKLAGAQLIVINGLELDLWMERLAKSANFKGPIVIASTQIKPRYLNTYSNNQNMPDPHAWHDVKNVILYCQEIKEGLIRLDPSNKIFYERNFIAYKLKLEELDHSIRNSFSQIARQKRKIVTTHDAFYYFSQAYGVDVLSPVGVSTDEEPSPQTIAHLIQQIKKENIKAIFVENLANKQLIKKIAQEVGHSINLNDVLYADSLSNEKGPAPTYIQMMEHNVGLMIKRLK